MQCSDLQHSLGAPAGVSLIGAPLQGTKAYMVLHRNKVQLRLFLYLQNDKLGPKITALVYDRHVGGLVVTVYMT